MENRGTKAMAIAALIVGVVGLTIGFAAFTASLTINSSAEVTATSENFKIGFSGTPSCEVSDNSITYVPGSASGATWSNLSIGFTAPGQTATCTATVANTGSYDAYLTALKANSAITCAASEGSNANADLVASACDNVTVEVTTSTTGGSLTVGNDTTELTGLVGDEAVGKTSGTETVTVVITYGGSTTVDGNWKINMPVFALDYASAK